MLKRRLNHLMREVSPTIRKKKITNKAGNKKEITIFRNGRFIDLHRRPRISFDVIYR